MAATRKRNSASAVLLLVVAAAGVAVVSADEVQTAALREIASYLSESPDLGWSTSGGDACDGSSFPGVTCTDGSVTSM